MAFLAVVLFVAALVLFLISTNQWELWLRGAVWAGGLLMVFAAGMIVVNSHDTGLLRAFGDLAANWYNPGKSVLAQAFDHNGPTVVRFVLALMDLFLILCFIVGIVALIAFTPGEGLERVLRPVMIGLVGAMFGGLMALGIVGTGFGAVSQQSQFVNYLDRYSVIDGESFYIGQVPVRLAGLDAPRDGQACRFQGRVAQDCGAVARKQLQDLVAGALVTCKTVPGQRRSQAYNLPVVMCEARRRDEAAFDIGARLVENGYAWATGGTQGLYAKESAYAKSLNLGLHPSCTVSPAAWDKMTKDQQTAFKDKGAVPKDVKTLGYCPAIPKPPKGGGGVKTPGGYAE